VNRGVAPYITPELAEFTHGVRVAIHQGTPTEVRYTVDGSEPTSSSPVYRDPFSIRTNTMVRARSFENGRPTAAPEARVDYRKSAGLPEATLRSADVMPGLDYEYYVETTPEPAFRMNWPVRWQVERPDKRPDDYPAKKTGTVATPSIAPRDTSELFSFRYTGFVRIPRTGVYTFTARSDDGAAMWIGDRNIFWSVGQSPKTTESWGQVALQAGLHPVTLTYFQAYGPMAYELLVEGPGVRKQPVPASWFFRPRPASSTR
jgi:hexosaminidase